MSGKSFHCYSDIEILASADDSDISLCDMDSNESIQTNISTNDNDSTVDTSGSIFISKSNENVRQNVKYFI